MRTYLFALALVAVSYPASVAAQSAPTCQTDTFGTSINWYDHGEALSLTKKQNKPLVLLHLSGNFRKSSYT